MRQPVRVVLADDHDAFVEGLGMVLSAEDDLEVVALAGDGASALQAVLTHHPDVLVVDTQMPGPAVTELVRLVGQADPATRVLLLSEDARLEPSTGSDPGGPAGMTRAVSARELAEAIRAVAAGFRVVIASRPDGQGQASPQPPGPGAPNREGSRPGEAARMAVHSPEPSERDLHAELLLHSLSERERQILALLVRGYSNRRIAEACYLSLNTVRTHVQNVLVKLGVHSKLEAAALAVRQGLVRIEDHLVEALQPEPGGRGRPWVPVRSIVATSSRPAPGPWSPGWSPGGSGPGGAAARPRPPPARRPSRSRPRPG